MRVGSKKSIQPLKILSLRSIKQIRQFSIEQFSIVKEKTIDFHEKVLCKMLIQHEKSNQIEDVDDFEFDIEIGSHAQPLNMKNPSVVTDSSIVIDQ